ncbi:Putative membrane spanning protein (plasmid) [Borrelia hermsii YBT]|uniref:virulence associated lipoprotein n=1 Tax=Borrelia hermsii TaxID=140 RepID=UPI0003E376DB|nr:virulence associated lipoprotein [Borrelia hermsii]AHH13050.1 Putative membrane spanning protein [Borrelia hermsii YBT]
MKTNISIITLITIIIITTLTCKANLDKAVEIEKILKEAEIETVVATKAATKTAATAAAKAATARTATEKALEEIVVSSAEAIKEAEKAIKEAEKQKEVAQNEKERTEKEKLIIENKTKQFEAQIEKARKQDLTQIKLMQAKLELGHKIQDTARLLMKYDNDYWIEPPDQFGLHDSTSNNKAFDVLKQGPNPYYHSDNKETRKKIYLVFEYQDTYIKSLGEILNKIAKDSYLPPDQAKQKTSAHDQANDLLQEIINKIHEHFDHYFNNAFRIPSNQQNKIDSLELSGLQELLKKFEALQKIRHTCKMYATKIYNDFQNDKNKIRTGGIKKIEEYITNNAYRNKFKGAIEQIKTLITQINNIVYKT